MVCQSPASLLSTTAQLKFKGAMGGNTANHHDISPKDKQTPLVFDNSKIIPLQQIIFMSVKATNSSEKAGKGEGQQTILKEALTTAWLESCR